MTTVEDDPPELRHDRDLVDQLTLLGRALGNPIRVRIAAALLRLDEAGPKDLTTLVDDSLGNVSYHVRYLYDLGFLQLERLIPRRGAIEHKYSLGEPLRRALPAAALALGREAASESPSEAELISLSFFLTRSKVGEAIAADRRVFAQIGGALSDEGRVEILGYLLQREHATTTHIAESLDIPRQAVERRLRVLAEHHMVAREAAPRLREHWTVTLHTKKALAGLYDLLMVTRVARVEPRL